MGLNPTFWRSLLQLYFAHNHANRIFAVMADPAKTNRLIYFLFLLVFTLASFEVLLRLFKVNISWAEKTGHPFESYYNQRMDSWFQTWKPGSEFELNNGDFSYHYKVNSLGLREKENFFRDPLKTRIICLGDSYTEGIGAPYDSTYPRYMEKLLLDSGYNCEVFNAGAAGSDPFFEYMLYRQKLAAYHPRYLLLQINQSDITDFIYRGGLERFKPDGWTVNNKGPWYLWLYIHSYVVRFFCNTWPGHMDGDMFITNKAFKTVYAPRAAEAIREVTDSVQNLARSNDCKLLVILQPIAQELTVNTPINKFREGLFDTLQKQLEHDGIATVNLWPPLKRKINTGNRNEFAWPNDLHYNSSGYRLFTVTLLEELRKKYPDFWTYARGD